MCLSPRVPVSGPESPLPRQRDVITGAAVRRRCRDSSALDQMCASGSMPWLVETVRFGTPPADPDTTGTGHREGPARHWAIGHPSEPRLRTTGLDGNQRHQAVHVAGILVDTDPQFPTALREEGLLQAVDGTDPASRPPSLSQGADQLIPLLVLYGPRPPSPRSHGASPSPRTHRRRPRPRCRTLTPAGSPTAAQPPSGRNGSAALRLCSSCSPVVLVSPTRTTTRWNARAVSHSPSRRAPSRRCVSARRGRRRGACDGARSGGQPGSVVGRRLRPSPSVSCSGPVPGSVASVR